MQYGRGRAGRCVSMVVGEGASPPLEIGKKDAVRGNFNLFHLCFTNEIRGESIHYTCKMEGWADRRVSMVGVVGGEGALSTLKIGKMMLSDSEEILTSFTYVLLMKLGGIDKHCIHAKNGRGWLDRRLSMVGGGGGE